MSPKLECWYVDILRSKSPPAAEFYRAGMTRSMASYDSKVGANEVPLAMMTEPSVSAAPEPIEAQTATAQISRRWHRIISSRRKYQDSQRRYTPQSDDF